MTGKEAPLSARSKLRVFAWVFFGTLGCVLVAVTYVWFAFRSLGDEAVYRGFVAATVLPIVLAGPLFFYLSLKLRELRIANHLLNEVASHDSLTDSLSRGTFHTLVRSRLADARQNDGKGGGGLLVIDADHFKLINDRFGHETGDEALRLITQAMRSVLRGNDALGRLGGEEFGIHLPGASYEATLRVAERVRAAVCDIQFKPDGNTYALSVSIGCAVYDGQSSFEQTLRQADQNLYVAKHSGRNRIHCDAPSLVPSLMDVTERT